MRPSSSNVEDVDGKCVINLLLVYNDLDLHMLI